MEFEPHYWNQGGDGKGIIESSSHSDDDDSNSPNEEDRSLPRQSVMRRPDPSSLPPPSSSTVTSLPPSSSTITSPPSSPPPLTLPQVNINKHLLYKKNNNINDSDDYRPTSDEEEEEKESSSCSSSEEMKDKKKTKRRARFNSSSSSSSNNTSTSPPSMYVKMDVKKFYKPRKELMISTMTTNCFYKTNDNSQFPTNEAGGYQRRAARNVRYTMDSESEEEGTKKHSKKGNFYKEHARDSDSDFQVSVDEEDEEEDIMSFGSDSLVEETSSDEYTPYIAKRGGGGGSKRGKKGKQQWSDEDFGRVRKRQQTLFSDESSDSDYNPSGRKHRGGGGGKRRRKKKRQSDYDDDDDDDIYDGYTRTTGRQREHISYKETSDDGQEDGDDNKMETERPVLQSTEDDNREKIDRILLKRRGPVSETGKTCYAHSIEEFNHSTDQLEVQYLVKWMGWSHLHNTWETESSLEKANVKGIKRLHNFIKKDEERIAWEERANPEDLEYSKIQMELNERLLEEFKQVERVIDARRTEEGSGQEYLVKWKGLPYSECTWEDGELLTDLYQYEIDNYMYKNESDCIPCRSAKVIRQRPKFTVCKEQPSFLGGNNSQLLLRDYQLDGVNWLVNSWCKNNSVILADEMGLGKTIQTISFLSCLFHTYSLYGPFLLVVPLSTLPSWQKEFQLWAPDMNVIIYIGDVTSRKMIQETEWAHSNGNLKFNALVTTYEILLKDKETLGDISWSVLAVDEAHRLKNDDSLLYRTLSVFQTNHRLLITGTPLQNSLKELWSLIHFIMRDKFPSWEEFEEQHQSYEDGNTADLTSLHQQLEPYLLRRIKKDVEKSLPAKVEQILRVEMSSVQKQYYRWILTRNYKALSKGVKGSITGFLNVLMELKKCCNHVYIVRTPETPETKDPLQSLLRGSGKVYLLDKLLVRLKETGHRVLIFSQMVRMLDILAEYMKYRRFLFQRLDGSITGQQRKEAIDHFNAEGSQDFCFLLSTRAGGLGVNLATADTVVIFDSDWNPQNDLQAQARAHRIGQTKQVNIYRFVTRNSVEEDIIEKAKRKMVLDHLVIQRMDTTGRTVLSHTQDQRKNVPFDKDELNAILKFGTEELFKEDDREEDKALKEMDIDEILRRAETQETTGEGSSVANELLSQFKVASFTMNEKEFDTSDDGTNRRLSLSADTTSQDKNEKNWDDIIPESYRNQIEEEEKEREQLQLYLPPRQRTVTNYYETVPEAPHSVHVPKRLKRSTRPPKTSSNRDNDTSTSSITVSRVVPGFTNSEIRRFVSSYLKFPSAKERLDAVAVDSELQEKSLSELEHLASSLLSGAQEAFDLHQQKSDGNSDIKLGPPTLKLGGVSIPVQNVLQKQQDLEILTKYIPTDGQARKRFRLVTKVPLKQVNWSGVKWTSVDDSKLLVGVYQYGLGNWETIRDDTNIGLSKKILPPNPQEKPQVQHLKTRVNFLLKALKEDSEKTKGKTLTNKRSKGKKDTTTSANKISNYFTSDREKPSRNSRKTKRTKITTSQSEEEEEKESTEDSSSQEDDDDFVDDWKKKKSRKRKRQTTTKKKEVTRKRIKTTTNKDKTVSPSNASKTKPKRGRSRGGTTNERKTMRKKGREKTHEEEEEEFIVSDYELDEETFTKCKLMLKPVKKCLMQLAPTPEDDPSQHNTVLEIGDHISTCLTAFNDSDALKEWRSHLWIFVAKFTAVSGRKLFNIYRNLKTIF